jgi:4a-hydroxytetrahydrobiopterin dehydratase
MNELAQKRCKPCEGGVAPLTDAQIGSMLKGIPGWALEGNQLSRTYAFRNYHETMAFVNATAWISHREDHHPDLLVGYNRCTVKYWTHAIGGLSENDFICAAKLDGLFEL